MRRARALIVVLLSPVLLAQSPAPPPEGPLGAGDVRTGVLKSRETHRYAVPLADGDFLGVSVAQQGADVAVTVLDPSGGRVVRVDNSAYAPERVEVVAVVSGPFVVELSGVAPTTDAPGYTITIDSIRQPDPADRLRAQAAVALSEASELLSKFDQDSARRAIAGFERALVLSREAADAPGEAYALNGHAYTLGDRLDDPAGASEVDRLYIAACRRAGDDECEARGYRNLGVDLAGIGDRDGAIEQYERALTIHRAAGRDLRVADALRLLASSHQALGDYDLAGERITEALGLARRIGSRRMEADVLDSQAGLYGALGEWEASERAARQAQALVPDDQFIRGLSLGRIGAALTRQGRATDAIPLLRESAGIWEQRNFRAQRASTLRTLAEAEASTGDTEVAIRTLGEAATLAAGVPEPVGEALARVDRGYLLLRAGRPGDAAAEFSIARSARSPLTRALALAGLARLTASGGDPAAADLARQAVSLVESTRARLDTSRSRVGLLSATERVFSHAVDALLALDAAAYADEAFGLSERARARGLLDAIGAGDQDPVADAADRRQRERTLRRSIAGRAEALDRLRPGSPRAEALERELSELFAELDRVRSQARVSREGTGVDSAEPIGAAGTRQLLDADTVLLAILPGEERSWAWVVRAASTVAVPLPARGEIEAAALRLHDAIGARADRGGNTATRRTRIGAADRDLDDARRRLGELVLGPVTARLGADWLRPRLVIVAGGALEYVPFAALVVPAGREGAAEVPLRGREIAFVPSASAVAALRSRPAAGQAGTGRIAVFADPVYSPDDPRVRGPVPPPTADTAVIRAAGALSRGGAALPRLPFSREEADAIASLSAGGRIVTARGFDASLDRLRRLGLRDYAYVHFATHGVIDVEQPGLSGLVLSLIDPGGRRIDGYLRLDDIRALDLGAELVVLSACQTAVGRQVRGEGLLSLTRGFLHAGARRVIASLWQVDDAATAELMTRFYRAHLGDGLSPVAALARAQRELAAIPRWSAPYYWAGFVLQGDWR